METAFAPAMQPLARFARRPRRTDGAADGDPMVGTEPRYLVVILSGGKVQALAFDEARIPLGDVSPSAPSLSRLLGGPCLGSVSGREWDHALARFRIEDREAATCFLVPTRDRPLVDPAAPLANGAASSRPPLPARPRAAEAPRPRPSTAANVMEAPGMVSRRQAGFNLVNRLDALVRQVAPAQAPPEVQSSLLSLAIAVSDYVVAINHDLDAALSRVDELEQRLADRRRSATDADG
jgi:hypothetical protein